MAIREGFHRFGGWPAVVRWVVAIGFCLAGANHFRDPDFYRKIVPPGFGAPAVVVAISGVCEIVGGVGLLIPALRRPAGWGLIALLIAVFPANIYMAVAPDRIPDMHFPHWMLWVRLPLQIVFVAAVWFAAFDRARTGDEIARD